MADWGFQIRRQLRTINRTVREARLTAYGALHRHHPIMAHIIPIRRCNLSCAYCNEYDKDSKPVPTETMLPRVNRLWD